MRHADHRHHRDGRMGHQHFLDLARVDVETAADDHVLDPVDDEEISVRVAAADVAGVEPPLRIACSVAFGTLVIAFITLCPRTTISPSSPIASGWSCSSTIATSTPMIAWPTLPGIRSESMWLKVATGLVSDRP
jgi:hypothetical protein